MIVEFSDVSVRRRGEELLAHVSLNVARGSVHLIVGPNGAGKTTLLNVCTGVLAPTSGQVLLDGERVEGQPPHRLCHKGLARTFQIPRLFASMSIYENVATGAMFGIGAKPAGGRSRSELVAEALEVTGLGSRADMPAANADLLSRKMTMLAAALVTRPKVIFMDEPLAGLTPEEIDRFVALIASLHERLSITFMVIEHKVRALARLCDRIMILHHGRRICLDTPERAFHDPQVIEVYLGAEYFA
jgi:branched-chain amino acid transport system ATP-binding protein